MLAFTKAQGAGNDFLIVELEDLENLEIARVQLPQLACRICSRRFGIGADGLEVVGASDLPGVLAEAHLWNSDGSEAEISGNGTRCVAAYLTARGRAPERFLIRTGAGVRDLERVQAAHPEYQFRMTMPSSSCRVLDDSLALVIDGKTFRVATVDVGNPQCVSRVDGFDFDWRALGSAIERHPHFPGGTNVSFVRVGPTDRDPAALEVRFWERGAGATLSSGTGSIGAAVVARHCGWVRGPTVIRTQGGEMGVDWEQGIRLTGPAAILAEGRYELGLAHLVHARSE